MPTPLMLAAEVANVLRVSPRSVYRLIERGELRVVRIGTSLRIPRAEVDRIVAGAERNPSEAPPHQ